MGNNDRAYHSVIFMMRAKVMIRPWYCEGVRVNLPCWNIPGIKGLCSHWQASVSTPFRVLWIVRDGNFCHHLSDHELISLLKQLKKQTSIAVIINDLHRHWLPYLAIKGLSRLLNFSYLAKNDGPLSVLRAFKKHELINLLTAADIGRHQIHWRWAFRWEIIIWGKV